MAMFKGGSYVVKAREFFAKDVPNQRGVSKPCHRGKVCVRAPSFLFDAPPAQSLSLHLCMLSISFIFSFMCDAGWAVVSVCGCLSSSPSVRSAPPPTDCHSLSTRLCTSKRAIILDLIPPSAHGGVLCKVVTHRSYRVSVEPRAV